MNTFITYINNDIYKGYGIYTAGMGAATTETFDIPHHAIPFAQMTCETQFKWPLVSLIFNSFLSDPSTFSHSYQITCQWRPADT